MGNYYCKKCGIDINYFINIEHSRQYNCREHRFVDGKCKDFPNTGNCRHHFEWYFYTLGNLKWDKIHIKYIQGLTVSSRVNFGFEAL